MDANRKKTRRSNKKKDIVGNNVLNSKFEESVKDKSNNQETNTFPLKCQENGKQEIAFVHEKQENFVNSDKVIIYEEVSPETKKYYLEIAAKLKEFHGMQKKHCLDAIELDLFLNNVFNSIGSGSDSIDLKNLNILQESLGTVKNEAVDSDETLFFIDKTPDLTLASQLEPEMSNNIKQTPKNHNDELINAICDFEISSVIENLLLMADDYHVVLFAMNLMSNYRILAVNQFGSHVLQSLFNLASDIIHRQLTSSMTETQKISAQVDTEDDLDAVYPALPLMKDIFEAILKEFESNPLSSVAGDNSGDFKWKDYMLHTHGCHVFRTILNVLAGKSMANNASLMRSRKSSAYSETHSLSKPKRNVNIEKSNIVPSSFSFVLEKLVANLLSQIGDELHELSNHPVANPLLQILISIPSVSHIVNARLLLPPPDNRKAENGQEKNQYLIYMTSRKVSSHLFEMMLQTSDRSQFKQIFKKTFLGEDFIQQACFHPIQNFVVQKAIRHSHTKKQFGAFVEAVGPLIGSLILKGKSGVIVELVGSGARFPEFQAKILQMVLKGFEVDDKIECHTVFVQLLMNLRPFSAFTGRIFVQNPQTNGSLILQHLLKYDAEHLSVLFKSLQSTPIETMLYYATNPTCVPVLETFVQNAPSKLVSDWYQEKICVDQHLVRLCNDKIGSHLVDKIFCSDATLKMNCGSAKGKDMLRYDLALQLTIGRQGKQIPPALLSGFHSRFVIRNIGLELFCKRPDRWVEEFCSKKAKDIEKSKSKKRETQNDIDILFSGGKKQRK